MAASTHADEEIKILQCWLKLDRPELLVIAPRHPERREEILKQLHSLTDSVAVRSRNDEITDTTRVYLLDTVGELNNWFAGARLVIMGGSFIPRGGHNLLEPAALGIPVVTGPAVFNFREITRLLLDAGACEQVENSAELARVVEHWLGDANERHRVGQCGKQVVEKNRGALQAVLDMVSRYL